MNPEHGERIQMITDDTTVAELAGYLRDHNVTASMYIESGLRIVTLYDKEKDPVSVGVSEDMGGAFNQALSSLTTWVPLTSEAANVC